MEIGGADANIGNRDIVSIESLPKTALQAIYHAVTGKTESLSKDISGNVIISSADIDRLYAMLVDQLGIHEKVIEPTVTVVVKHANDRSLTYSSWERFKKLRVNNHEITSEITLKLEFVIQLPETPQAQRCIITVNLDSSLPVIHKQEKRFPDPAAIGIIVFFGKDWRTVRLSIDFVDFLVAKAFTTVVEEWFSTLKRTPIKRFNDILLKKFNVLRSVLGQFGRIGMAVFLGAYIWFSEGQVGSLAQVTLAVALGLLIWAVFVIVESSIENQLLKKLSSNIVPSVIILTEGDENAYSEVIGSLNSPTNTMITYGSVIVVSVSANIMASYIYTYLVSN